MLLTLLKALTASLVTVLYPCSCSFKTENKKIVDKINVDKKRGKQTADLLI